MCINYYYSITVRSLKSGCVPNARIIQFT